MIRASANGAFAANALDTEFFVTGRAINRSVDDVRRNPNGTGLERVRPLELATALRAPIHRHSAAVEKIFPPTHVYHSRRMII